MSEAITRADLLAVAAQLYREGERIGPHADAEPFFAFARVIRGALAAHAPAPLPDLPPHVTADCGGHTVHLGHGRHGVDPREYWLPPSLPPDDLDRIADACRILAARERARRAQG